MTTKEKGTLCGCLFFGGGGGGNRTPVRKRFNRNFSGRRRLFTFPCPGASRHAQGLGSFMIHGALKALRTHGHHSSTPQPGPWSSRGRRSLIKQREEQNRCCSLIYKTPILRMVGASARYSCLHTPVETSTPPRRKKLAPFRFRGLRKSRESSISAPASEETRSASLPRFARKLRIRSFLPPCPNEPALLGFVWVKPSGKILAPLRFCRVRQRRNGISENKKLLRPSRARDRKRQRFPP